MATKVFTDKSEEFTSEIDPALANALQIEGATGVAVVDAIAGVVLLESGKGIGLALDIAMAIHDAVLYQPHLERGAGSKAMEDVLFTFEAEFQILRPLDAESDRKGLFLFLALDREKGNLAMARRKLATIAGGLTIPKEMTTEVRPPRQTRANRPVVPTPTETTTVPVREAAFTVKPAVIDTRVHKDNDDMSPFLQDDVVLKLLGLQ
jgi:hypothetical protein